MLVGVRNIDVSSIQILYYELLQMSVITVRKNFFILFILNLGIHVICLRSANLSVCIYIYIVFFYMIMCLKDRQFLRAFSI